MNERLAQAAEFAENGEIDAAYDIVLALLVDNKRNFDAWHALSQLAKSDRERRHAIYNMWGLCPDDPEANLLLDKIRAGLLPPLNDEAHNFSSRNYHKKPH